MSEMQKVPDETGSDSNVKASLSFQDFAPALAGILAATYLCGFVAVTAHLGRYGLRDYDAFRVQYLVAGAMIWMVIGVYYFIVGRHLARLDEDVEEYRRVFSKLGGTGSRWAGVAFFYTLLELLYFVAACSIVLGTILFSMPEDKVISVVAAIFVGQLLISQAIAGPSSGNMTRWSYVGIGAFYLAALIAFLSVVEGSHFMLLLYLAVSTWCVSEFNYLRSYSRHPKQMTAYSIGVGLILVSGAFGGVFYERVRSSIGGGTPLPVRLVMIESATPTVLREHLAVVDNISAEIDLLAESPSEILIRSRAKNGSDGKVLRVRRELISAMSFDDPAPAQK